MSSSSEEQRPLLSVVIPAMNEEDGIDEFHRRTTSVLQGLDGLDHELVYVDDGSSDGTYGRLAALCAEDDRVRVVKLSRNFGHQVAITAGLDHARGDAVVVIDADLQDPPEVIPQMVARWREGYDVVYGQRAQRSGEGPFKLLTAAAFYRLMRMSTRLDIPLDVGDFRLVSKRVAAQLRGMREKDRFVRGLVSWVGYKQTGIDYQRDARYAGATKYPLRKMVGFAVDGITSFSTSPLRVATWLGFLSSILAFLYLLSIPFQYLFDITVPGFSTIMVAILFLGGVQLICLGIIGEYMGRVFTETKGRPLYIVSEALGGESTEARPPLGNDDRAQPDAPVKHS